MQDNLVSIGARHEKQVVAKLLYSGINPFDFITLTDEGKNATHRRGD
jgi:hypothetical protein